MTRPHFTIRTKNSVAYDANHIAYATMQGGLEYAVTFVSSGGLVVIPVSQIAEIAFYFRQDAKGADYCGACGFPLPAVEMPG